MNVSMRTVAGVSIVFALTFAVSSQLAVGQSSAETRASVGTLSEAINASNNTGRSIFPTIRADGENKVHLVWLDDSPGNFDIFFATWDGAKWSSPVNISRNEAFSLYPTIALDSTGQVHASWMDGDGDTEFDILYSQGIGEQWTKPHNVSNMKGTSQRPQIAIDGSGVVHVVWFDNQEGNFQLFHSQLVNAQWTPPASADLVEWYITHNPGWSWKPAVAAAKDGFDLAWVGMEFQSSQWAMTQNIRHSHWDGTSWSKPDNASKRGDMQADMENPALVADAMGKLHLVFEDRSSIFYSCFDGKQWSKLVEISEHGRRSALPDICAAKNGLVHVAWLEIVQERPQVFYRQLNGQAWSYPINISGSPGSALGCTLAAEPSGVLHLSWMDDSSGEYEIVHRRLTPNP